jgi:homoserine/homoserine lactone efflux protein
MSLHIWLTFVFTASLILIIPGPTIIYIVGQSLKYGRKASIPLSIGGILGDATCITLSLIGLSAILSIFSTAFIFIKYIGAGYLVYLGTKMLISNLRLNPQQIGPSDYNSKLLIRDAFLINALNPKGIIFYSAFMPQFVTTQDNILYQFVLLSLTFLCLALITVILYSLLASRASQSFKTMKFVKGFNITGGLCLICTGFYSATIKRK